MFKALNEKVTRAYPPYPEYPYSPPVKGVFHNQSPYKPSLAGNYTAIGEYSVYIPDNFEPYSPAVILLPQNGVGAQVFFEGAIGLNWRKLADDYGIALVIAEAYNSGDWNTENVATMRDDDAFLKGMYDTIRDKMREIPAVFDIDDKAVYIAGYGQGGTAAHKFSLLWPLLFSGVAVFDGEEVSPEIIEDYGAKTSFPFVPTQNSDGREAVRLLNKDIPLPVRYVKNDEFSPESIYVDFFSKEKRDISEPGGIMRPVVEYWNEDGKGFFFTEREVDGHIRRWITYVPTSYNPKNVCPLLLAIHGGAATPTSLVWDSMWHERAEKLGFIVVFPHAFVNPTNALGWMPLPSWNQYGLTVPDAADDVEFIKSVLVSTKQDYSIDEERVYATGHSNGSGMTWRLGLDIPEYFTAIAPVGLTLGSFPIGILSQETLLGEGNEYEQPQIVAASNPLPVYAFMGRFDGAGADEFKLGNMNDLCLKYWGASSGFDPSTLTTGYDASGRYFIRTWTNGVDDIPIFKYATAANCPHTYVPSECDLIWEYFSRITLDADGARYFDGRKIIGRGK